MAPRHAVSAPEIVTEPREVPRAQGLVERVAEHTAEAQQRRVELPSGRVVDARAEGGEEHVTIRSASGVVELEVILTAEGPRLRFHAADLSLTSKGAVRIDCDTFHVRAQRGIIEETAGDRRDRVGGDATVEVTGDLAQTARSTRIESTRGNVDIEANDDVKLVGERIKLNC